MKDVSREQKVINAGENVLFFLNALIAFILVFESRLYIPSWLQVIGRVHPLLLHFPIVILFLGVLCFLFVPGKYIRELRMFLLIGALTASVTILMGIFLALENDAGGTAITRHKWLGVLVGIFATILYYQLRYGVIKKAAHITAVALVVVLIGAGHFGAVLTHGDDFIFEPIRENISTVNVPLEEAMVFEHLIEPIFKTKCTSCHNPSKAKGELVMTDRVGLLKGGKTGSLYIAEHPEKSLMIDRILLPETDKKHMPPRNKSQLTEEEKQLLYYWIRNGAALDERITAIPPTDSLFMLARQRFGAGESEEYTFKRADEAIIKKLNNEYRVVFPVAATSPALFVNIYNSSAYSTVQLQELMPVAEQIVSLDLNSMPVTDEDMKMIGRFKNLRRLNLNGTSITGSALQFLSGLENLKTISLSSTSVKVDDLSHLSALKKLKHVYAWNSEVSADEGKNFMSEFPSVVIETGFQPDHSKLLRLPAPRIENEKRIFTGNFAIKVSHPVKGVSLRYTLDGTIPDSIHGEIFEGEIISETSVVKVMTRAYKEGWYGSELVSATFFRNAFTPDSIKLITYPDKKYFPGYTSKALVDLEKGDLNFGNYYGWYGYRENSMEVEVVFAETVQLNEIILSTRADYGAHIFPPRRIQVWGGSDKKSLRLLATVEPTQPKNYNNYIDTGIKCVLKSAECKLFKIKVDPLEKLPAWHQKKGKKAWTMVDEILFN